MIGKFITVEGIDGAGKTEVVQLVSSLITQAGFTAVTTREPGGTRLGESIRNLLLSTESEICTDAETLLMFAVRAQHLDEVVLPALKRGEWVVSDRFTDSTYAYQGGGRGKPFESIAILERWVQNDLRPDFTLYLDTELTVGKQRLINIGELDRFEREHENFHERVRAAYNQLAASDSNRIQVIDASQPLEAVRVVAEKKFNKFLFSNDI